MAQQDIEPHQNSLLGPRALEKTELLRRTPGIQIHLASHSVLMDTAGTPR